MKVCRACSNAGCSLPGRLQTAKAARAVANSANRKNWCWRLCFREGAIRERDIASLSSARLYLTRKSLATILRR
jgi:hypothetical protein